MTATYSPDDNKLRLSSATRLDREIYDRVREAGFRWAPKQEIFVVPMWTPEREDLLIELCGEIGDEDTSLADRAEERAERFEDYSGKRAEDADRARKAVAAIADGIPLGQPILVGHHSERHARKDAERIENGMRRAVKMWETANYWKSRAAGAIRHAKYKERPDVRARRIKGLEADLRKQQKALAEAKASLRLWQAEGLTRARALAIANRDGYDSQCFPLAEYPRNPPASQYEGMMSRWSALDGGVITAEQARDLTVSVKTRVAARCERWIAHLSNRLEYERAMLADAGGTIADKTGPEKGGAVRCWASLRGGWSFIQKVNKVSVTLLDNWGNGGGDFPRTIEFDKLKGVMTKAEVDAARAEGRLIGETQLGFYLRAVPAPDRDACANPEPMAVTAPVATDEEFRAIKESLKAGVQMVSAPQLFPTPPELAERMGEEAMIEQGDEILEPSVGTGRLLDPLYNVDGTECKAGRVVAVEINHALAGRARATYANAEVVCGDFLEQNGLGKFNVIIMNPPFANGQDIKHIRHAMGLLKPGGRLVAICANGPRQREKLGPLAHSWEDLPDGTFESSGTGVRTALLYYKAPLA